MHIAQVWPRYPAIQESHDRPHQALADIAAHKVAPTQDYTAQAGEDIYGQYVFHEEAQRQYLAKPIFQKLRRTTAGLRAVRPGRSSMPSPTA